MSIESHRASTAKNLQIFLITLPKGHDTIRISGQKPTKTSNNANALKNVTNHETQTYSANLKPSKPSQVSISPTPSSRNPKLFEVDQPCAPKPFGVAAIAPLRGGRAPGAQNIYESTEGNQPVSNNLISESCCFMNHILFPLSQPLLEALIERPRLSGSDLMAGDISKGLSTSILAPPKYLF